MIESVKRNLALITTVGGSGRQCPLLAQLSLQNLDSEYSSAASQLYALPPPTARFWVEVSLLRAFLKAARHETRAWNFRSGVKTLLRYAHNH